MARRVTVAETQEMSPEERFKLAHEILGTLDEDFLSDAEQTLIAERLANYHRNPTAVHRWEDVKRELFGK